MGYPKSREAFGQAMIVKKLKRTVFNKPKAAMISGLVDYILAPSDAFDREKRVYAGNRNFITTTAAAQKLEMISLAGESVHSRMPVTHWVLSWSDNETPTTAQVDEAVAMFLRGMELEEHQAIYAVHGNTDNVHVHILVNRVHPCTERSSGRIGASTSGPRTAFWRKSSTSRDGAAKSGHCLPSMPKER